MSKQSAVADELLKIFEEQKHKNLKQDPSYSLRKFSQDMGVDHSMLSRVLSGDRKLSTKAIEKISKNLKLTPIQVERIKTSNQMDRVEDADLKTSLQLKLQTQETLADEMLLTEEQFSLLNEWYYFPLLNMIEHRADFDFSVKTAEQLLGISKREVLMALKKLEEIRLITFREGRYSRTKRRVTYYNLANDRLLQMYQRKMLSKFLDQLGVGNPDQKFSGTETLSFSEEGLEKVKKALDQCFDKIIAISQEDKKTKSAVYQMMMFLYPLISKAT